MNSSIRWIGICVLAACSYVIPHPIEWIPFKDIKWGFTDRYGVIQIPPKYDYAYCFTEDRSAIIFQGHQCGYIDEYGEWLISPRFKQCEHMEFGMAPVRLNDSGWIFVNWKGERLTKMVFKEGYSFKPTGTASVELPDNTWLLLDTNFEAMKFNRPFTYLSEFLVGDTGALACETVDRKNRACGVINQRGEYISDSRNVVSIRESGLVFFGEDSSMGAFQLPSDTLLMPVFKNLRYASGFYPNEYLFWVSDTENRHLLINRFGRIFAQGDWDTVTPIYRTGTIVQSKGKYGLLDSYTGNILLPTIYASIEESCVGYVLVGDDPTGDHLRVFDVAAKRFVETR